jgi:hypothetical protein
MLPVRLRRFLGAVAVTMVLFCAASVVRAEEPAAGAPPQTRSAAADSRPDTTAAFVTGALSLVVGMGTGASLIGSDAGRTMDIAGWMVMQSSFTVAPFVAHGVAGEWGRGCWFSTVPLATTAGSATVFAIDSNAVRHSNLTEQRILWSLFVVGIFSSAYGVVDASFADSRARRIAVAPLVGRGTAGLQIGGTL